MSAASIDLSFLRSRGALTRLGAAAVVSAVLSAAYASRAEEWYASAVVFMPSAPEPALGGAAGPLGGGAAGDSLDEALAGPDSARIASVLQSDAVTDAVIQEFDLKARYGEAYQESAREAVWRHCSVRALPKPNVVQLTCEDPDPALVLKMLAAFAERGNQSFRRAGGSWASEEVRFLERHVGELQARAEAEAGRARALEERHGVVDLDAQDRAVMSSLARLNSELISTRLGLDYVRTFSSTDEPAARQLEAELAGLAKTMRALEERAGAPERTRTERARESAGRVFPPALELPKLRAEYEAVVRDRRVAEATLTSALERLEAARASAGRDGTAFVVLDPPALPTQATRPRRGAMVAMLTLLGVAFAVTWEAWRAGVVGRLLSVGPLSGAPPER